MNKGCNNCKFAKRISSGPCVWSFVGCTYEPYQGKRCVEIEKCPKKVGEG
ncbi:MAG TPA: hypothetical protein VIK78_19700 [Ruminiclostridium sp.]